MTRCEMESARTFRRGALVLLMAAVAVAVGCSDMGKGLQPVAEVSPGSLDFGTIAAGDTAALQATLTNSGPGEVSGTVSVSGAEFLVVSGGGPFALAAGQSVTATVDFAPHAEGVFRGQLSFGPGRPVASLVGTCSAHVSGSQCQIVPPSLAFGDVALGQSATKSFVIRSTGTQSLAVNVAESCPGFSITAGGGSASIPPGDSVTVSIRYAPQTAAPYSCTVTVGAGCPTVGLSGTGIAPQVSYAADVQPIYTQRCATSGCHSGSSPDAGLNLAAGVSYAQTVNVVSRDHAPALLIRPNDLSGSVIYQKIANTGKYGGRMPKDQSLTTAQINTIGAWILAGAPNN